MTEDSDKNEDPNKKMLDEFLDKKLPTYKAVGDTMVPAGTISFRELGTRFAKRIVLGEEILHMSKEERTKILQTGVITKDFEVVPPREIIRCLEMWKMWTEHYLFPLANELIDEIKLFLKLQAQEE